MQYHVASAALALPAAVSSRAVRSRGLNIVVVAMATMAVAVGAVAMATMAMAMTLVRFLLMAMRAMNRWPPL